MKNIGGLLAVISLLAAVVIGFYFTQGKTPPEIKLEQPVKVSPAPVVRVEPAKPQPVQEIVAPPLPELKDSDPVVREAVPICWAQTRSRNISVLRKSCGISS
jgi:hypothetical protein